MLQSGQSTSTVRRTRHFKRLIKLTLKTLGRDPVRSVLLTLAIADGRLAVSSAPRLCGAEMFDRFTGMLDLPGKGIPDRLVDIAQLEGRNKPLSKTPAQLYCKRKQGGRLLHSRYASRQLSS